jgi:orotidine-5'-phosphate decarboxylase
MMRARPRSLRRRRRRRPRLLGVTILTSFTAVDVEQVWNKEIISVRDEVARLAGIAAEAGLHGVVTSPLEVEALKRRHGAEFLVVTPGIRPAGDRPGDQARTATPAEAARPVPTSSSSAGPSSPPRIPLPSSCAIRAEIDRPVARGV